MLHLEPDNAANDSIVGYVEASVMRTAPMATDAHSGRRRQRARFLLGALLGSLIIVGPGHVGAAAANATPKSAVTHPAPISKAAASKTYGQLPISFEVNQGQTDSSVKFLAHSGASTYFITPNELVMSLSTSKPSTDPQLGVGRQRGGTAANPAATSPPDVVHMALTGANPNPTVEGVDELPGKTNYFIGNDPAKWHTDVATYAKVKLHNVYPGIDLVYYGTQQGLEYDIDVAAGANPAAVGLDFTGASKVDLDAEGAVQVHTKAGTLVQHPAIVYQQGTGGRTGVRAHYVVRGNGHVGLSLGGYDHRKALIIDPSLVYSTYLGGSGSDFGSGIAVDGSGDAYITGITYSTDFPTQDPIQSTSGGTYNAFITEINADGSALVYSTYLGGSGSDRASGIAVDGSGDAYITGGTTSTDFPTHNPIQSANAAGSSSTAFITKINAGGSALVYSTYLGGSGGDFGSGIAVDGSGNAYITGDTTSTDFPTHNPIQSANASGSSGTAFITEINAGGSSLVYSTYLGGSGGDDGFGIAVDGSGDAYITGVERSTDFPTQNPIQSAHGGGLYDAFITEINAGGSALVYSTYLGGSGSDFGFGIAVDGSGDAYITGETSSTDFPTHNPIQATRRGNDGRFSGVDAFITEVNAGGSAFVYSTYLGGFYTDEGNGIAVDGSGNAYVTGETFSTDFPMHDPIQSVKVVGSDDVFITKINAGGSALVYSTYLGGPGEDMGSGIAVDGSGNAYITGYTTSTDFPTYNPIQSSNAAAPGEATGFVTVVSPNEPTQLPPSGAALALGEISASNSSEPNARCQSCAGDPVNTADGTYSESATDLSVAGRSYPLAFSRSYSSANAPVDGSLGYGWAPSSSMNLGVVGSAVTVTQENGSTVTFTLSGGVYTAPPRVIATLTLSGGFYTFMRDGGDTYTFNSGGQLTSEKDLNGYTTTLAYSGGNLSTVTDPAGRTLNVGWTGSHITTVTDANVSPSRVVTYQYNDGNGNLTDVIDVNGGHAHFTYDSNHQMLTMLDPKCYATSGCPGIQNTYSGGEVIAQDDQLNRLTTFGYSVSQATSLTAAVSTTTITDPMSNVVVDNYQYGLLTAETRGYGTPQASTIQYRYDPDTLARTSMVDGNANTTTYTVDSSGNPVTLVDPLGHETINTYNSFNEVLTSKDPNQVASVPYGATTTNTYDGVGNLTSTSRPLRGSGETQVTTYVHQDPNHPGDVTSMVDPDGNISNYVYDIYGDKTQSIDPLGNRTTAQYNADGWVTSSYTPKGAAPVAQGVSGGGSTTGNGWSMALRTDGTVFDWGNNSDGELGNGTTVTPDSSPGQVCVTYSGSCSQLLSNATSVSAGGGHTLALKSDGTAWAWGSNWQGQLGTGNTTPSAVSVQVTGLSGLPITAVAAGYQHSVALTSGGNVYAWGRGSEGQLGSGRTVGSRTPVEVCDAGTSYPCSSHLSGVTAIAGGSDHTFALKSDGTVWAWGSNTLGQLGNGTSTQSTVPVQVCATFDSGTCTAYLTGVATIAAGNKSGLALGSDGTVSAWGNNDHGQLASGAYDTTAHPLPVQVSGLPTVTKIAEGNGQVLAIAADGRVQSWGRNDHGQLGIGSANTTGCKCRTSVQTATALRQVVSIAAGDTSSLATTADGNTWSWGGNAHGELGNGTSGATNSPTPSTVSGISGTASTTYRTQYTHDPFGHAVTVTDPLGHVTKKTYDSDNNLSTSQDPNQSGSSCTGSPAPCTRYGYDVANELTTNTRADSTTLTTDYNGDGTILDQKDGKGNAVLTYGYDSLARVTTSTDALGNVTTFTYDAVGNRLTQQDPGGNCATPSKCTTTTYDADNEATGVTYSDGVTANITSITYDKDGQRIGMTDGTGTSAWVFDSLHRVTSYTNGNGTAVSYAYNLRDLPTTITYPGGHNVTNAYDNGGRMTSVQDWLSTPNTSTFGYDANSNLTSDAFQSGAVDSYTFNAADQSTAINDAKGGTPIFAATYTRDGNGQVASDNSQVADQASYQYTPLNQLCYGGASSSSACASPPANSYSYGFDSADNLTTMESAAHSGSNAQQFNNADELCWTVAGASSNGCGSAPAGATTFGYDDRGNRTSQVPATGAATCTGYDQADRLTSVITGSGSSCASPTTVGTYAYSGDGVRQSKSVAGTTTQFLWSGSGSSQALLDEQAGSATPTYYIYGAQGPIEQVDASGNAHFYHTDQIGSVRAVTNTGGTTDATYTYDPYGNVVSSTNPGSITNNLQFQGQYLDSESGLYYLRARYYDPATAQFMSRDPMVAKTRSPYAYVSGDPLSRADPSGLWFGIDDAIATVGGAIIGAGVSAVTQEVTTGHIDLGKVGIDAAAGAIGGEASLYLGPMAGGAIAGGFDGAATQVYQHQGFANFSWGEVAFDTAAGAGIGKLGDYAFGEVGALNPANLGNAGYRAALGLVRFGGGDLTSGGLNAAFGAPWAAGLSSAYGTGIDRLHKCLFGE